MIRDGRVTMCRGGRAGRNRLRSALLPACVRAPRVWWELRRGSFNPRFRKFLESSPAPRVPTFIEIMGESAVRQTGH